MGRFARSLGARVACIAGVHHAARRRNRRRLLIVCYHGVAAPGDPPDWLLMPPSEFSRQLRYLARHYRVLAVDEALRELWAGSIMQPTACVTFDDGYLDNLTEAIPQLERARIPATIYLTTGLIGTRHVLWTTELELACDHTLAGKIALAELLGPTPVPPSRPARAKLIGTLKEQMKAIPSGRRRTLHRELLAQLGEAPDDAARPFRMMTWQDVARAEASGTVTFGAHTVSHEILSRLDDSELEHEIAESIRDVKARVERPSETFAYPNGRVVDFDDRAKALVAATGSIGAVSTIEGLNDPDTDRFALRRVTLGGDISFDEFRLRTAGLRRPGHRS